MPEPTTMLYKCPGPHEMHGVKCDYCIVPDSEVDGLLEAGKWYRTPAEAHAGVTSASEPKTEREPEVGEPDEIYTTGPRSFRRKLSKKKLDF